MCARMLAVARVVVSSMSHLEWDGGGVRVGVGVRGRVGVRVRGRVGVRVRVGVGVGVRVGVRGRLGVRR